MRVAAIQIAPLQSAPDHNLQTALRALREAEARGVTFAVLPECAISGYAIPSRDEAERLAEPIPGPSTAALTDHCRATGMHVACGLLERDGERLYNAAVLIGPGGLMGKHRKGHLVPIGADAFVAHGEDLPVFEVPGARIGMLICYEVRFPEISRVLALKGAQMLVIVANWPAGALVNPTIMVPARAAENNVHVVAANRAGREGDFSFIGRSCIHGPDGACLAAASESPEMLIADLAIGIGLGRRDVMASNYVVDLRAHRRPDLYGDLTTA
jgi:predicted amidohydrolase